MAESKAVTSFKEFTVTTKGKLLDAKVKVGITKFQFTRAIIGSGLLPDGYNVLSMTSVIEEIPSHQTGETGTSATVDLTRLYQLDNGIIGLTIQVKNGDKGFRMREIAIMALDPDEGEILYAYANSGYDYEPFDVYDGKNHIKWILTIPFIMDNLASVKANITLPAEVTHEEFDAHVSNKATHMTVCLDDMKPEGNNYLWFSPFPPKGNGMEEIILQAKSYNGDETKLHAEIDGVMYTADNTAVSRESGETTVTIEN